MCCSECKKHSSGNYSAVTTASSFPLSCFFVTIFIFVCYNNCMKKTARHLLVLLIVFSLITPAFSASKSKQKTMYVSVDSAQLKAKPSTASKKLSTVEYKAAVVVLKTENSWCYVQLEEDSSIEGWLPESALTSKKIKDKNKSASADADEIALAGKGFNSTIEAVYAQEYEVNFDVVDYIESLGAATEEAVEFARQGELNDGGAE